MFRRSLGAALWTLVGLLAGFLGALSSLVGTGAGRALLARVSEGALRQVFTGTVEIGDVRGSLLTGLTLSEVRLFDADTTLVAWLPQANLSYNPFDFAAGRVVLFEFDLRRPVINIVQHPNGRLNIEELLRLGGPDKGPHGPATLILFRNVRITDGTVTLRLQAKRPEPGDSSLEIASDDPNGRLRIRRFEHLDARLSALQVSSPRERGIRIDITRLAMESSDPEVRLVDVAGRLRAIGDSMDVQLARVRLPRSALRDARGTLRWPHGPLLFDLRLRADSATLADFPFIDGRFAGVPAAGVVSGDVRLRSHSERVLEVGLDPLRLAYGGGTVGGRLIAFSVADSGLVALRDAELDARAFDLEFARPFLDTLPFAGRLTGRTIATGPLAALALETDWSFRDSLVPGWPETRIRGKGEVNLKAADGMRFQPFSVEASSVDLGTVAQLAPAVRLHGTLFVAGTLNGPLRDAQFAGTLEHRDGELPPSVLTGSMRLDTRSETLGIYADVTADSLSFDGLRGSFPTLPLQGTVTGPMKLAGPLDALETNVVLHSPGGDVRGDGTLMLDLPHYGAQDMQVTARDLDLAHWLGRVAPPSRLNFTIRADFAGDSAVSPLGTVQAILEPSRLAGAGIDSGAVHVRFADRRLYVDSLRVAQPGHITTGSGSLGWTRGTRGQLALDFDADSLNVLDPLIRWLAGDAPDALAGPGGGVEGTEPLAGSARVLLRLEGSLDSLGLDARASVERLAWRAWRVPAGRGHFTWQPGPAPTFALDATLDSIAHGVFGFSGAFAAARGTPDSLTWLARARIGEGGAFLAGGRFARRADLAGSTALAIGVDSLAVQLPGDVWVLERPTELTVTDSAATVTGLVLQSACGSGKLVLEGALPTRGRADAHLQLEAFPLVGLYALLERDTAGVGGTVTATAGLSGTRASPVSSGSFSLSNGVFGEFRAPFVALGPADPRRPGVPAAGPRPRVRAAPPASRHPVGRCEGGQRGPLRSRGAHAIPAACDRRVLGGSGDRGDVGRAAPAGRPADRQCGRDHPDPERALRGRQRASHLLGRHGRHPVAVGPKRARPGRLHRHRAARAADAPGARPADRRGPVQGAGLEEQRGDHRQRPAVAQGAGLRRQAHRSRRGDVGRPVFRRPGAEADRELGRARGHVARSADSAAAARPRVRERVSRQPADRRPRARNGQRRVAPLGRGEHPARRLRTAHQAAQSVPRERYAAGGAGDLSAEGGSGVARVRRHRRDGALLRHPRSGRGARHQGEARRPSRGSA